MTPEQAKEYLLEVAASGIVTRARKYVEIQLDPSTWDALQEWKNSGASLSENAPASDAEADEAEQHLRKFVERRTSYPDDAVMMHMDNDDMIRMRHLRALVRRAERDGG